MDITEYRNRGRRPVTLPSGLAGFVRPPSVMDLAAYPRLLRLSMEGKSLGGADALQDWVHCVLRRCFIPDRGVMCDKEPGQCLPGELSVRELAPDDASAILEAVSGLAGEASDAAANGAPGRTEAPGGEAGEAAAFPAGTA